MLKIFLVLLISCNALLTAVWCADQAVIDAGESCASIITKLEHKILCLENFQNVIPLVEKQEDDSEENVQSQYTLREFFYEEMREVLRQVYQYPILEKKNPKAIRSFIVKYSAISHWNLRKVKNLSTMELADEMMAYFKRMLCTKGMHFINNDQKHVKMECGNICCYECIGDFTFGIFCNSVKQIKCGLCSKETTLTKHDYLEMIPMLKNNAVDPFKTTMPIPYHQNLQKYLKKCPKLSCNALIEVSVDVIYNKYIYAGVECINKHTFCLNCHASFDHTPLVCSQMVESKCNYKVYWSDNFFKKNTQITTKTCSMCGWKMHLSDFGPIFDCDLSSILDYSAFYVCKNCKHIALTDAENEKPSQDSTSRKSRKSTFSKSLAWFENLKNNPNKAIHPHIIQLKDAYQFVLMTLMASKDCYSYTTTYGKHLIIVTIKFYVNLWENFFEYYANEIEKHFECYQEKNASDLVEIAGDFDIFINNHKQYFKEKDVFTKQHVLKSVYESYKNMIETTHCFNFERYTLVGVFGDLFWSSTYGYSINCPKYKRLSEGYDPVQQAVQNIKIYLQKNQQLQKAAEDVLNRPLDENDILSMASATDLDLSTVIEALSTQPLEFLKSCKISVLKVCFACFERYEEEEYELPECSHDELCTVCIKKTFQDLLNSKRWNIRNGLFKCLTENCNRFYHPTVIKTLFGKHSNEWKQYDRMLLRKFALASRELAEYIECFNCSQVLVLEGESYNPDAQSGASEFCKSNQMLLKTVTCPSCSSRMCYNCRQPHIHFSAPCGISLDLEIASYSTMCPGCKSYGARTDACPSMTCDECNAKFCFACGVEAVRSGDCANPSYPDYFYEHMHKQAIDEYHEMTKTFLRPLLDDLRMATQKTHSQYAKYIESKDMVAQRLGGILKSFSHFCIWHQFLAHFICKANFLAYKKQLDEQISTIKAGIQAANDLLESGEFEACAEKCLSTMKPIESLDELIKSLQISNKIMLPKE